MFLHSEALDEINEKLTDINRTFTTIAIVTGFKDFWTSAFPNAEITADTDELDLALESYDLVIHAMSLHWSNDPVGQVIQCRRALKPDGVLLVACLGGETLTELRAAFAEAEVQLTGGLSPRVAPMAQIRELGAILQRAGLALPVADRSMRRVSYENPIALMHDLRAMGETNAITARNKNFGQRHLFETAARIYLEAYSDDAGRILASFELVFLTGWAPSAAQPQPLRPGSATTRLADFLQTTELGEDAKPVKDERDNQK
ncbi:MAG: methyltransferase domain-containing protein [Pseudomonadota bacterium]